MENASIRKLMEAHMYECIQVTKPDWETIWKQNAYGSIYWIGGHITEQTPTFNTACHYVTLIKLRKFSWVDNPQLTYFMGLEGAKFCKNTTQQACCRLKETVHHLDFVKWAQGLQNWLSKKKNNLMFMTPSPRFS